MNRYRSAAAAPLSLLSHHARWLTLYAIAATSACNGEVCDSRLAPGVSSVTNRESSSGKLSTMDLLDIVRRYYYSPWRLDQVNEPGGYERLLETPEFKAWRAAREDAWSRRREWSALLKDVQHELPGFYVRNEANPSTSCYEVAVWIEDPENPFDPVDPKPPKDGKIFAKVVVRVSYFAPVYELYETSEQAVYRPGGRVDEQGRQWPSYINFRRTHTIRPALRPAADALARAIEAHYGYQLVDPDVLNIQLVNTALWEDGVNRGTLREALFSDYRL